MIANKHQQNPALPGKRRPGATDCTKFADATLDGRFIAVTYDAGQPLRPQFEHARAIVTGHALRWLKAHPDTKLVRVGKRKSVKFYAECRRIDAAIRQGVPRDLIERELWPTLERWQTRRRFDYRVRRWRALADGHYLELIAAEQAVGRGQTSDDVVFPFASPVDRVG